MTKLSAPTAGWWKGLGLTVALAAAGYFAAQYPGIKVVGPLCVTLILGLAWRATLGLPAGSQAGTKFAARTLLRLGIVLLGARVNFAVIQTAGPRVLAIDLAVIVVSIGGLTALARAMGLSRSLAILMGFGTGICGASAVVAAATVARADEESTSLAVGLMGILGTLGVLFYAVVGPHLGLSPEAMGVLTGSTLHEVAQVIAAASLGSDVTLKLATVVKLSRVVMLAPALVIAGLVFNRGEGVKFSWREPPIPYFVLGFLAIGGLNSLNVLSPGVQGNLVQASIFLMAIAMGGMGLNTDPNTIRRSGWQAVGAGLVGFFALFGMVMGLLRLTGLS